MVNSLLLALGLSIGLYFGQSYEIALLAAQALRDEAQNLQVAGLRNQIDELGTAKSDIARELRATRAARAACEKELTECVVVQQTVVDAVNAAKPACAKQVKSNTKVLLDRLRVRPEEEE